MEKVGEFEVWGVLTELYSEDNIEFFEDEERKQKADEDTLKAWAFLINSPWSQKNLNYKTELNCKDAYTEMTVSKEKEWKTTYSIVGYDGLTCEVIGYGENELESMTHCIDLFNYIQKTYNPEDEKC